MVAGGHPAGEADLLPNLQRASEPNALLHRCLQVIHLHAEVVRDAVQRVAALHHVGLADVCSVAVWEGTCGCWHQLVDAGPAGSDVWVLACQ